MMGNQKNFIAAILILNLFTGLSLQTFADDSNSNVVDHEVVRRVAFFPFETDDEYKKDAEAGWSSVREFLSNTNRFYVATKKLMVQNDVFQPRHTILNTDAILLGKLLEADCIISTILTKTEMKMFAYSGVDGFILCSGLRGGFLFEEPRILDPELDFLHQSAESRRLHGRGIA